MSPETDGTDILRIGLRKMSLVEMVESDPLLWRSPLLSCLPDSDRLVLLASGRLVVVEPDEDVRKRSELEKGVFFVLQGAVSLSRGELLGDLDLGRGDLFGLDAVVNRAVRFASKAAPATRLAWFPGALLLRMASGCEGLADLLRTLAAERWAMVCEKSDFMDRW